MSFDNIVQRLEGVRPYKSSLPSIVKSVRAKCPACGGSKTKLNISLKNDGMLLIHCHGSCEISVIAEAIGIELSDLFPSTQTTTMRSSLLQNKIKGWDWWSLTSALEKLGDDLTRLTILLTEYVPQGDQSRKVMTDAVSVIKDLSEKYKYGRGVK